MFRWLAKAGNIDANEMARTFNCGIGLVMIASPKDHADEVTKILLTKAGRTFRIGTFEKIHFSKARCVAKHRNQRVAVLKGSGVIPENFLFGSPLRDERKFVGNPIWFLREGMRQKKTNGIHSTIIFSPLKRTGAAKKNVLEWQLRTLGNP